MGLSLGGALASIFHVAKPRPCPKPGCGGLLLPQKDAYGERRVCYRCGTEVLGKTHEAPPPEYAGPRPSERR